VILQTVPTGCPSRCEGVPIPAYRGDLLLTLPGADPWAIEVKRISASKVERGFHSACADLNPQKRFYGYPVNERFPLDDKTDAISVVELARSFQPVKWGQLRT
jgi:hypothetical protein